MYCVGWMIKSSKDNICGTLFIPRTVVSCTGTMPIAGCVLVHQHDTSACTTLLKTKKEKRRHIGGRGRRR